MHTETRTAEQELKEIALDFEQFIDADTQLDIGATFDKPLRERLRLALARVPKFAEREAELNDQIIDLEKAECDDCEDLENDNLALERRIEELERELAALKGKAA